MAVDEVQRGFRVEFAPGDHRAGHRRGEHQLRKAPRVEHRRHDHYGFLGPPRRAVQDRLERAYSGVAARLVGALGCSGGAGGEQDHPALAAGALGLLPGVIGDEFLDGQLVLTVGPGHDAGGVRFVGQRAVHRRGELLVVDDGVDAFAVDHVGQRRPGE